MRVIYRRAREQGALRFRNPEPGDLVFFRDTYDKNHDGRRNDGLTHIGLVENVDPVTGTFTFIHRSSTGVSREKMNVSRPTLRHDPVTGEVLNDYLRSLHSAGNWPRLSGELFAGFAAARTLLSNSLHPERTIATAAHR